MEIFTLFLQNPILGLLLLSAIVVAIGIHEASHAYMANWLGDPTPKIQKRLTLNPLSHLDTLGTLLIIFAGIGWGKPVEFNPYNLKNPKRDIALIAIAGPLSNILIALFCAFAVYINLFGSLANQFLTIFATLNVFLAVFNLIPVDPLDGFKVVGGILPDHLARQWYETKKYGFIVLMVLIISGATTRIVFPIADLIINALF